MSTHSITGVVMIFRRLSVGRAFRPNSSRTLLHTTAIVLLPICTFVLSISLASYGQSAEKRATPNIVLILADDKY